MVTAVALLVMVPVQVRRKLIDIGVNLTGKKCSFQRQQCLKCNFTDLAYQGIYNNSQKHAPDLVDVIKRAVDNGIVKVLFSFH